MPLGLMKTLYTVALVAQAKLKAYKVSGCDRTTSVGAETDVLAAALD